MVRVEERQESLPPARLRTAVLRRQQKLQPARRHGVEERRNNLPPARLRTAVASTAVKRTTGHLSARLFATAAVAAAIVAVVVAAEADLVSNQQPNYRFGVEAMLATALVCRRVFLFFFGGLLANCGSEDAVAAVVNSYALCMSMYIIL